MFFKRVSDRFSDPFSRFSNRFSYRFKSFSGAVSFCRHAAALRNQSIYLHRSDPLLEKWPRQAKESLW